jgi:hypothetical protein
MLRPRFPIVEVATTERADSPLRMLYTILSPMKYEAEPRAWSALANAHSLQWFQLTKHGRDQFRDSRMNVHGALNQNAFFGVRSFFKVTPSFITKTTFSIAMISWVGSPSIAKMSAKVQGSMVPMRSDQLSNVAPLMVAACKACSGVIPPRTSASTSFGKY